MWVDVSTGVSCIGYTDLVSRLPTTSSNLFGNNVAKFILSIQTLMSEIRNFSRNF